MSAAALERSGAARTSEPSPSGAKRRTDVGRGGRGGLELGRERQREAERRRLETQSDQTGTTSQLTDPAAGWPRRRRRTPRRRRAASAWSPGAAAVGVAAQVRLVRRSQGEVAGLRHHQRLRVHPAADQHQPLGRPGDDPVGRWRTARRTPARRAAVRPSAAPAAPSRGPGATPAAARRRGVARATALVGRHRGRGGQGVQPGQRLRRRPAEARAPAPAARPRPGAHACAISSPVPARTSSRLEPEPSRTALACAPRSSDSAVSSGEVRRRPAVAQHRVDPVARGGVRRGHALEALDAATASLHDRHSSESPATRPPTGNLPDAMSDATSRPTGPTPSAASPRPTSAAARRTPPTRCAGCSATSRAASSSSAQAPAS